jgi:hypothetical protein
VANHGDARVEWRQSFGAVTDWKLKRDFEIVQPSDAKIHQ